MVQYPEGSALIIVAYRLEARKDAEEHVRMPPDLAPGVDPKAVAKEWKMGNVADPVKVQAKIEEKRMRFLEEAPGLPLTGHVSAIKAVDLRSGELFECEDVACPGETWSPAARFMFQLFDHWGHRPAFPSWASFADQPDVVFLGFNPKRFIRVAAIEAAIEGVTVPLSLWYGNQRFCDPYEMLVGEGDRAIIGMEKLGYRIKVGLVNDYPAGEDLDRDLRALRELVHGYKLVPGPCLKAMQACPALQVEKPKKEQEEPGEEEVPRRRRKKKEA